MAGITNVNNMKIQDLEKILNCLTYKSVEVSLDISAAKFEIERRETFAHENEQARSRVQELKATVRCLLREERRLESQIQHVKERIQAEAAKDRRQAQQDSETDQ